MTVEAPDLYRQYLDQFAAVDFEKSEWYQFGRVPVLIVLDVCWDKPEDSFDIEEIAGKNFYRLDRFNSNPEYLIHPESYVRLKLLLERRGKLNVSESMPPLVIQVDDRTFLFDYSRVDDDRTFKITINGDFEIYEDDQLWERLEVDARASDPRMDFRVSNMRETHKKGNITNWFRGLLGK